MKKVVFFILLITLFVSCGKEYKDYSRGSENAILTVVEDSLWLEIKDLIASKVEKTIRTPQREKLFYFVQATPERFEELKYSKNILFITTLDKDDKVSNFVKSAIPEEGIEMVKDGKIHLFNEYDKIARRQNFMVLVGKNLEDLKSYLKNNGGEIYNCLDAGFINRQFDQVYYKAEQKKLSKHLLDKFGFSFRVANDYIIFEENKSTHIIQMGRSNPDRWVTIYYENGGFNDVLSVNWAWRMRYWLGKNIMQSTYIEKEYVSARLLDWNGRSVNNIRGIWAHDTKTMGGPFSSFYFYDGATDRTYFLDITIWAPGQDKNVYLRQMEVMLSTFYTKEIE